MPTIKVLVSFICIDDGICINRITTQEMFQVNVYELQRIL